MVDPSRKPTPIFDLRNTGNTPNGDYFRIRFFINAPDNRPDVFVTERFVIPERGVDDTDFRDIVFLAGGNNFEITQGILPPPDHLPAPTSDEVCFANPSCRLLRNLVP